jgi:predicted nucleic acid-binding protein
MADLLVDTDVFIDHLKGFERLPRRQSKLAYSIVTRAELFAGPEHQLPVARRLLGSLEEIPVDRRIAERAGEIRRSAGIRLPDALIAATALVHELPLRTRNRHDFRRVAGLRLR